MKILLACIAILGLSLNASAEGGRACKEDIQKFCKDVKPGGGAIIKCLKSHESELSASCKGKQAEMKEHMKEVHEACKGDVEKLCKDVKPGEGRIRDCLKAHEAEISAGCKAAHHDKK